MKQGSSVTTNVMMRDMDLALPDMHNARRLEVVVVDEGGFEQVRFYPI